MRLKRTPLFAVLAAVALGAALAAACAALLLTALRLDAPPQRLEHADVVITGGEHTTLAAGDGKPAQQVALTERAPLSPDVAQAVGGTYVKDLQAVTVNGVSAESLRRRFPGLTVLTGDDRGRAEAVGVAPARLNLILIAAIFGGLALIVMAILLASIIGLAVEQRHREFALLRTIGATPRQVRRLVRRQTLLPALAAAGAGACAGPPLARALFSRLQDGGVVPPVLRLDASVPTVVAGALVAFLVARVSSAFAARRAAKAHLGEALGEVEDIPGTIGPIRTALSLSCVAIAVSTASVTLFMSPENAAAVGGSTALAGALAIAFAAPWIVVQVLARFPHCELAVTNLTMRSHRTAALVTPVVLVAAITLGNVYQQTTQAHAMAKSPADGHGWIERPVDKAHRIDPRPLKAGPRFELPETIARKLDVQHGDDVGLVLGDGTHHTLAVAALNQAGGKYPAITVPARLLPAHAASDPLRVDRWITFAVVGVIVAYAALSLVNALATALAGRRGELDLLRLAGATKRQIRRMLQAEALLIGAIGAFAGTIVSIAGLVPLAIATAGSPLPSGSPLYFLATLALIAVLLLVPTRIHAR